MIDVQLYIENNRIDLFDDETISLTSSIQNVRDIAKVFSDYSQTFTVPANDRNNKLFKHFYNFDIDGFNATTKKRAKIELNHAPFREGFIYVEGCNLKNNVANTYTLVFYGGLVFLKDKVKDHTLESLVGQLNQYDHEYTAGNVLTGFTTGLSNGDIIYPLITPEKRLYFDSTSSSPNYNGNLFSDSVASTDRGLDYLDLKPAIKVIKIIKAIEEKYSIDFTGFFDTDDTKIASQLGNLYLWLSRDSGRIIDYTKGEIQTIKFTNFVKTSESGDAREQTINTDNDTWYFSVPKGNRIATGSAFGQWIDYRYRSKVTISNITPSTRTLTIKAIDRITGDTQGEATVTGSGSKIIDFDYYNIANQTSDALNTVNSDGEYREFEIYWVAECDGDVSFEAEVELQLRTITNKGRSGQTALVDYDVFNNSSASTLSNMEIYRQMPDMTILDFLTGLFKVFNLTAYVNEPIPLDANDNYNPVIDIKPLDNYYADAILNTSKGTIDLSDSIDVESHSVEAARPFTKVSFKYEETKTVLMEQHTALHNKTFGNTSYPKGDAFDFIGEEYEVEIPFSHLKYERLYDSGVAGSDTEIQWGYAAGGTFRHEDATTDSNNVPIGNYSPEDIKPLLFYGINQTIADSTKKINWISGASGTAFGVSQYLRPSNSNEEGGGTAETSPTFNLNFDSEFDEWYRIDYNDSVEINGIDVTTDASLFALYYRNYITGIYNPKKRIFKYNAYLPAKVLTTYKLNDQIKIHDNLFHINTMSTNITTGQTNLELINIIEDTEPQIPTSFEEPTLAVTPVSLGYADKRGSSYRKRACDNFITSPVNLYMNSSSSPTTFANAEFLYQDPSGTIPPDGFYSDGIIVRGFFNGKASILEPTTNCSGEAPHPYGLWGRGNLAFSSVSANDACSNYASNTFANALYSNPDVPSPVPGGYVVPDGYLFPNAKYVYNCMTCTELAPDGWYVSLSGQQGTTDTIARQSIKGVLQTATPTDCP